MLILCFNPKLADKICRNGWQWLISLSPSCKCNFRLLLFCLWVMFIFFFCWHKIFFVIHTPYQSWKMKKTRTVSDLTEWYPRLQYYDVQTLEYRLPMKKERIWSNVKGTTSHLQNKLTKNIHLGVATKSSTKWDCLKPIRFHQYTWGLQHFLTFVQEDIGHIKCYWFKINYLFLSSFYIANIHMWKGQLNSYFIQE